MSCNLALGPFGAISLALSMGAAASSPQPLVLEHKFDLPDTIKGHFDHFEVDPAGQRIFATAVDAHQLIVINFNTGQIIESIHIDTPRAVVYREDLGRLFVTDGAGALRIYDSKSYSLVKSLKVEVDADPIAYDPANGHVFAVNGGDKARHDYSHITVFDSVAERQIANIKVAGDEVEGVTVEANGPRLFANARALNQIAVINRETFRPMAIWPIEGAKLNTVAALDEHAHRLFVACHEGNLLILDSDSGKQLQVLPIGQEADYIAFEPVSRKIFVSGGGGRGWVDVIKEDDGDHYHRLGEVTTEPGAATSHLVSALGKYIVMAPSAENRRAQVLVFKIASEE
jgi:DNA-binding beta-propeller fold protein YncE